MKVDWILFDADNTLFDFTGASIKAFESFVQHFELTGDDLYETYEKHNHACWTALEKGEITQETLRCLRFKLFFDDIGFNGDSLSANAYYLQQLVEHSDLYEESFKLLTYLKEKSYNLGLITNGLKEVQRPRLKKTKVDHFFDVIVVSDEIGHSKPDPKFFDEAFIGIQNTPKDRVVVVGDSLHSDIQGGNNYGVNTIWYNPQKKKNNTTHRANKMITKLEELFLLF